MRITLVVHQFPPRYFTGTERYALAVGRELQRRGHEVRVFALDPEFGEEAGPFRTVRESVEGLEVTRFNYWMWLHRDWARLEYRHPWAAEFFARHLHASRSEIVHAFHLRYVGADLIRAARAAGVPVAVHLTDFWFLCPRVTLVDGTGKNCEGPPNGGEGCISCHDPDLATAWESSPVRDEASEFLRRARGLSSPGKTPLRRAATFIDRPHYLQTRLLEARAILAPTRFLASVFASNGIPADRIRHQPYGIDVRRLAAVRKRTMPEDRPVTFGFIGTIAPHKGPHVLAEAMQHVQGPCRVLFIGRTSDFPAYSERLARSVAADSRMEIRPPFDEESLPRVMEEIDALVVPSLWHENAPFVVLEARAAGRPVLASAQGGLAEVVRDGVDGELFRSGDHADLGRRLQRLLHDRQRLRRLADSVVPPRDLSSAVDELEETYGEIRPA
ncbi:MAG: glycosyltransferase family 4 protein [Planctomycetota bacterium]